MGRQPGTCCGAPVPCWSCPLDLLRANPTASSKPSSAWRSGQRQGGWLAPPGWPWAVRWERRLRSGRRVARPHGRDDVPPVQLELLLLVAVHQVQVELIDAGPLELAEPDEMVVGRAQDAEPVDDLIGDERGV